MLAGRDLQWALDRAMEWLTARGIEPESLEDAVVKGSVFGYRIEFRGARLGKPSSVIVMVSRILGTVRVVPLR